MSDIEQESIGPLKYQLRQWREIVNMHLPHTGCDRDDAAAIDRLIQSLTAENKALREHLDKIVNNYSYKYIQDGERVMVYMKFDDIESARKALKE